MTDAFGRLSDSERRKEWQDEIDRRDEIINSDKKIIADLRAELASAEAEYVGDPAIDARWNDGVDFAQMQLCAVLKVDPKTVNFDAATEELEGDVRSVIGNILTAGFGDNWQDNLSKVQP